MATTLMPVDPATSPQHVLRVLTISAHLLPDEIVAARRARRTRTVVLVILAVVILLLGAWYAYAVQQKASADNELRGLATEAAALQRSQTKDYADVVQVQGDTATIDKQLGAAMIDDLPWAPLLKSLTTVGTASGVSVTGINASIQTDSSTSSTAGQLPSTATTIGSISLMGTAPDKKSVAKYVDQLGNLSTVANPFLTNAAQGDKGVEYTLTLDIRATALCGQYTKACKSGGK